jgi:hypothetical protein
MNTARRGNRYLGMQPGDLAGKPYARFWNPQLAPLAGHILEAIARGPVAAPLMPRIDVSASEVQDGSFAVENGYALTAGGEMHLALRTDMPGTSPEMVDWWFGWHSAEPERYKLWHPQAHVHAAWCSSDPPNAESLRGRDRYLGRTSCVDEYLGSTLGSYAIRFLPPRELGFDERKLADPRLATCICARVGFANLPFDIGYLAHHVSRTERGAVMHSRFWIGGQHAAPRRGGILGSAALWGVQRVMKPRQADAEALLVHCAQEMPHLASFLPEIFAELGDG